MNMHITPTSILYIYIFLSHSPISWMRRMSCWKLGIAVQRIWQSNTRRSLILLTIMGLLWVCMLSLDETYPYPYSSSYLTDNLKQQDTRPEKETNNNNKPPLNILNVENFYNADFKCIKTRTRPRATVCLYNIWQDMYISHDLQSVGTWELQVLKDFQEVLRKDPELGVIDVGANIGYYTMISAKMGHKVVAVEPSSESCYRIHLAAQKDQTAKQITLLHNAVADKRRAATLRGSGDNQGDTRIEMEVHPCIGSCPPVVQTILMDDLLLVANFTRAIIKLDIQGYEHLAFQHASKLLSQIHVPYIFMEWILMREFFMSDNRRSTDKVLVEEMMSFLFRTDYRPYALSHKGGGPLDPRDWGSWPDDIVWHKLLNEEEQEQVIINHFKNWPP